jgi:alpha-beta hydrolase superfamily lysophospholipase
VTGRREADSGSERARNAFEVFFSIAAVEPAKRAEFDGWVRRTTFWVPAQGEPGGGEEAGRAFSREISLGAATRIRLKSYLSGGEVAVPFFSDSERFDRWSAPDPTGRFVRLSGADFFALVPPGATALLNPGSERFSKWFGVDEVNALRSPRSPQAPQNPRPGGGGGEALHFAVQDAVRDAGGPEHGENPQATLHARYFAGRSDDSPVVFCVHGAIENARVFYSVKSPEKGFAPYLASRGFHVYAADLRGHGESVPPIGPGAAYGQFDAIASDIPVLAEAIAKRHGIGPGSKKRIFWVAHSWGAVLQLSALARRPELLGPVAGLVFFGAKRVVRVLNWESVFKVHLFWNTLGTWLARRRGFLDAAGLGWGSDSETVAFLEQSVPWVRGAPWVDRVDGFDYAQAVSKIDLPPTLYLAGAADRALGHPDDVRRLLAEAKGSAESAEYWLLSRSQGYRRDYGHIDMLTHPEAPEDHFPKVVEWMERAASQ